MQIKGPVDWDWNGMRFIRALFFTCFHARVIDVWFCFFADIVNLANQFLGYVAFFATLATSSLIAQEITFEQQMDDLDAKATALSKRLEDSEARSQRMNAFVAQARARLEALRAGRATGEPIQMPEQTAPPVLGEKPNPAIAEPGSQKPVAQGPAKLRKSKGYYLQAFGGYLLPRTVNMKTNIGKVPIEPKEGFSTGLVFVPIVG